MKKNKILILAVLFCLIIPGTGFTHESHDHAGQKERGIICAKAWLKLVDSKKYRSSWGSAAQIFKSVLSADQWEKTVTAVREPLGVVRHRYLFHDKMTTALPGQPDGHYLILKYASAFANKAKAIETITLMEDSDGNFRVAGYFIK